MDYKQLTLKQRYEIKAYMQAQISKSAIAEYIGVGKATVYRELVRNSDNGIYNPEEAHQKALDRRKESAKHVRFTEEIKERVEALIRMDFSPEQVSGYLKHALRLYISHETIYQHILSDKASGGDLYTRLRCSSKKKRKRYGSKDKRGQIPDRVSIDQRPEIVDSKERIGDWEVDTIIGKNHKGAIVTAVERKSKFTCIRKVPRKTAEWVSQALIGMLLPYKDRVFTITYDNGKEFSFHKQIALSLEANGYFTHPYHSWERGLNENTNGLIRQYFPKKSSFDGISENDIRFVENRLNMRPRKTMNFQTPIDKFFNIKVALGT